MQYALQHISHFSNSHLSCTKGKTTSTMELLNEKEILSIVEQCDVAKVVKWSIEDYSKELLGYLGDHLRLKVEVLSNDTDSQKLLVFFVKSMPRFDTWKANYIKELSFFKKEYIMLSRLFKHFDGERNWRPKLLFIKENVFVFEDVVEMGYVMPDNRETLTYGEIVATVEAVAKFHAQSYIFEEKRSLELERPYRIWEEYSDHLQEPPQGLSWRVTGRNAVIDFLKVYSKHRDDTPDFSRSIEVVIPMLFKGALELMKPSSVYRNVVVHRDLWTNNIFFKHHENEEIRALILDFQTVLYCSPMLDLSSLLFFNTTREFRTCHTESILNIYYKTLSQELNASNVDVSTIIDKGSLMEAYDESVMFGITQASLIVPIIAMDNNKRKAMFCNPNTSVRINTISRSQEFIQVAKEDEKYRARVTELFDDIVERYLNKTT